MLTDKVKDVLTSLCEKLGYSIPNSDDDYLDVLFDCGLDGLILHRHSHRWWDTYTIVKKFDLGLLGIYYIGYEWALANRDLSIFELGWLFNPLTISFYTPKLVTITTYITVLDGR